MAKKKDTQPVQSAPVEPVTQPVQSESAWLDDEPAAEAPASDEPMVRLFSQRPGDLIMPRGTLKFNGLMDMPKSEADALIAQWPNHLRII